MSDHLENRIAALSDDDLRILLTTDADQYRPEALELARAEAARRALEIGEPAAQQSREEGSLGEALRAFAGGVASEFRPGRFTAAGKQVACAHCGGESFELRQAVVNTRALTFFRLDWLNRGASVLVCEACGLLAWFQVAPERIRD